MQKYKTKSKVVNFQTRNQTFSLNLINKSLFIVSALILGRIPLKCLKTEKNLSTGTVVTGAKQRRPYREGLFGITSPDKIPLIDIKSMFLHHKFSNFSIATLFSVHRSPKLPMRRSNCLPGTSWSFQSNTQEMLSLTFPVLLCPSPLKS